METTLRLTVNCSQQDNDDLEELATKTEQLRDALIETEVESVVAAPGGVTPPGARGVDPVTIGTLLVTLAASRGVLVTLLQTLQAWVKRHEKDSIIIEGKGGVKIKITGQMSVTKDHLVEAWINHQLKS